MLQKSAGLLITFEGIDVSGKSTQIKLLQQNLESLNLKVVLLRDPGSTIISEQIRLILLDKVNQNMGAHAELLLYEAARAQMVHEFIQPALAEDKIVLLDRFYDSTTAYQGYGRDLPLDTVAHANKIGSIGISPDLSFYIDIDWEESIRRKAQDHADRDRLENEDEAFFIKVRNGYLNLVRNEPERVRLINGSLAIQEIATQIFELTLQKFPFLQPAEHE